MKASLADPSVVFLDGTGKLFNADTNNHRIRVVDPLGVITTLAGDGNAGFPGDGGARDGRSTEFPDGSLRGRIGGGLYRRPIQLQNSESLDRRDDHHRRWKREFQFRADGGPTTLASLAFPSAVYANAS